MLKDTLLLVFIGCWALLALMGYEKCDKECKKAKLSEKFHYQAVDILDRNIQKERQRIKLNLIRNELKTINNTDENKEYLELLNSLLN